VVEFNGNGVRIRDILGILVHSKRLVKIVTNGLLYLQSLYSSIQVDKVE
jgi:hypothetical protein